MRLKPNWPRVRERWLPVADRPEREDWPLQKKLRTARKCRRHIVIYDLTVWLSSFSLSLFVASWEGDKLPIAQVRHYSLIVTFLLTVGCFKLADKCIARA